VGALASFRLIAVSWLRLTSSMKYSISNDNIIVLVH